MENYTTSKDRRLTPSTLLGAISPVRRSQKSALALAMVASMQFFQYTCLAAPSSLSAHPSAATGAPDNQNRSQTLSPTSSQAPKQQEKPVLDPNNYVGEAHAGYAAAKECPEVCAKLFCYCGCDNTDDHSSLLDCFTSDHGVDCYICQQEALIALKMTKSGKTLPEIQKVIDLAYKKEYPWEEASPAFKRYKAAKLWQDPDKLLDKFGSQDSVSSAKGKNGATTSDAKGSKQGAVKGNAKSFTKGACCGGKTK